ncbi:MAG: hypothetical protein HUU28_04610 [Planctomycetaceae bacterium]|nr:hypothetical protein [Planctomycetaceae bacterium]
MLSPLRVLPCLLLVASAHAQATFPLDFAGTESNTGGLRYTVAHSRIDGLVGLPNATLPAVLLPDGRVVDLALERLRHERQEFQFHIDGAPVPNLLDGLGLSVWKGEIEGLPQSDVHLAFSHVGVFGWIDTGTEFLQVITRPAGASDWWNGDVLMVSETSLLALGAQPPSGCTTLRPQRTAAPTPQPSGGSQLMGSGSCNLRQCKIALESDFQYYERFNNSNAQAVYTATLWSFISDRYETQTSTILTFPYVGFYTTSSDPWTTPDAPGSSGAMLGEFQAAWVGNIPGGARLGHFMSGAGLGGGVAWLGVLCDNTYNFAVSGNLAGSTPFPVGPGPSSWDFMVCAHELGHNFSAPHTHDYCPPLDECAPSGYFGQCQSQQVCTNQGTIMSYCHTCAGGMGNVLTAFHPVSAQDMTNSSAACLPGYEAVTATPPSITAPSQTTPVSVTIAGTPVGAVNAHWRASVGMAWQSVTLSAQGNGVYSGSLPVFTCSDRPQWYVEFVEQSCGTITYPASAPATPLALNVGSFNAVFLDDFEADLGWTPLNLGAAAGLWQRGVPVNDPSWGYAPLVDGDGSGSCWLTGNQMGNSDVDNGAVQLLSPQLDLSGQGASLEYLYYLRLTVSNGVDMLKVEISPANGAGPWTEIARHTTSSSSWRSHTITGASIEALGVTLGSDMRVRFTANDGGSASIVEAALDGFRTTAVTCQSPLGLPFCLSIANSSGQQALMSASGSTSVSANNLVLSASVVPAQTSGLFLYGTSTSLLPFGNGFKCVGSPTRRLPVTAANATSLVHAVDLTSGSASGVITSGTTWYFQAWFRDNAAGGSSTGLSDGLRLTFLP